MVPAARRKRGSPVVLLALALAVVHLAVVQFNEAMPMRQEFGVRTPVAQSARMIAALGSVALQKGGGGNVQLHFVNAQPLNDQASLMVTGTYYGLNYALYPARAFIGRGDRILNTDADILAADVVPPVDQLRARGITTVIQVSRDPMGGWAIDDRPVR